MLNVHMQRIHTYALPGSADLVRTALCCIMLGFDWSIPSFPVDALCASTSTPPPPLIGGFRGQLLIREDMMPMEGFAEGMEDIRGLPSEPPGPSKKPALHGATDFISWTWDMVNAGTDEVGWSGDGERVVVANPERLATTVLPLYFRHGQYASWVRALNAYNFRKARPGQWFHPHFRRGHPEKLKLITRKQTGIGIKGKEISTQLVSVAPARRPLGALLLEEKSRLGLGLG